MLSRCGERGLTTEFGKGSGSLAQNSKIETREGIGVMSPFSSKHRPRIVVVIPGPQKRRTGATRQGRPEERLTTASMRFGYRYR